jgi:hypothetical protein
VTLETKTRARRLEWHEEAGNCFHFKLTEKDQVAAEIRALRRYRCRAKEEASLKKSRSKNIQHNT